MTTDQVSIRRPRAWLLISSLLAIVAIGALWPLQQVGQICTLQYPAPPGCFSDVPRWVPLVAIGLIVVLLAASYVVFFTVHPSRTILVILAGVIVVVALLAAAIVALSQTGIWDPYQPPIMID